jgi:hypothetical protein
MHTVEHSYSIDSAKENNVDTISRFSNIKLSAETNRIALSSLYNILSLLNFFYKHILLGLDALKVAENFEIICTIRSTHVKGYQQLHLLCDFIYYTFKFHSSAKPCT